MNGILLIKKEAGMSSHDVVARLRRILKTKKIGHSGTLDPDATGVLLVLVNNACKILPYLEDTDKEYQAELVLGKRTTTDDIFGEVLETKEIHEINDFQGVLNTFLGEQQQLPPMVSSVRVNGKKLYEYARQGIEVERPIRNVKIYDIKAINEQDMVFQVSCSSGTYIRSLCVDIAAKTDNVGCMGHLIRTKVGRFTLSDCVTLDEVEQGNYKLFDIYDALSHFPMINYEPIQNIYHGKTVEIVSDEDEVVIVKDKVVVAVYKRHHGNWFSCARGLW